MTYLKLYGDPQLHWIIMLVNDITDRYHGWPLSERQFNEFINEKYSNPDGIHHYEVPQSSGDTSVFTEVYSNSALYTGDTDFYSSATAITNPLRCVGKIEQNGRGIDGDRIWASHSSESSKLIKVSQALGD